ncbi:MAG: AAA family ATPase [Phycisphaerales bacterium]
MARATQDEVDTAPAFVGIDGILGQGRAIATLTEAMASGRVHHAWIFAGPFGVGKFTTARAFASMLMDPTLERDLAGTLRPDPESTTQRLIREGNHPDLHVITKELALFSSDSGVRSRKQLTIAKEVILDHLLKPIALAPTIRTGSIASKVFIVDEAELLDRSLTNAPTQNAMLKCLEEPPDGSVIILVTTSVDALLPTIRSRCQIVSFNALDDPSMDAWLGRAELGLAPDAIEWVKRYASGSPGRAVLAATSGIADWRHTVDPILADIERGRFDPGHGAALAKTVDDWAAAWVKSHANASKESASHAGADHMFNLIADRLRERLRGSLDDPARSLVAIDALNEAQRHAAANVSLAFVFDNLVAALTR